jgi:DNA-binding NarL/FixJ family response regulator
MDKIYKVVIIDDHNHFRKGLKYVLSQTDNIEVIAEGSNGIEFLDLMEKKIPDVVLMDISMPEMDGIKATRISTRKYRGLPIIALTMFDEEKYCTRMLNAGAKGFISKDLESEKLIKAITRVADGRSYFSKDILNKLIRANLWYDKGNLEKVKKDYQLSDSEEKVLRLLCLGLTDEEIASELSEDKWKVMDIENGLLAKTQTTNMAHLVSFTLRNRLLRSA